MIIVIATIIIRKTCIDTNNSRKIVTTINIMILKIILINLENMGIQSEVHIYIYICFPHCLFGEILLF